MSESVSMDFIQNNLEVIMDMASKWLGVFAEEYELTTMMNPKLKTFIIDKSIIYASAIASGGFNVSNFEECFVSEEINAVSSFVIPTGFRKKLENEIDEVIQEDVDNKKETLFVINPDGHMGRKEKLYRYVVFQIKLMYKQYTAARKIELPIGLPHMSFEETVNIFYNDIVNRAIQFSLCYEANNKDDEMCRKILLESASNSMQYHYRLERHVDIALKKKVSSFLKTYLNKKFDFEMFNADKIIKALLRIINKSKNIDDELKEKLLQTVDASEDIDEEFRKSLANTIGGAECGVIGAKESLVKKIKASNIDEFQEALVNTVEEAEKAIDEIFHFEAYKNCQKCRQIRQEYTDLFKNSLERVTNPAKLKNFKIALKKAKLNYVSKYNEQYIYPFVYDLIVMSFSFSINSELNKSHIEKTNIFVKSELEMKYRYIDKDSDENYLYQDLQQLIDALPEEFRNVKPALLIIKHYSEILEVNYKAIADVLKQLRVEEAKGNSIYAFPNDLKNTRLSIDEDHFRILSLDII